MNGNRCKNTVHGHEISQSETFVWEQFWSSFQKINMQYWNDRNKAGHHILEVLEYSFRDTLSELKLDHSASGISWSILGYVLSYLPF